VVFFCITFAGASKNGKAFDLANNVNALRAERLAWYALTQAPTASKRTIANCIISLLDFQDFGSIGMGPA